MRPQIPLSFEQIISKPRLDSYRHYFHVNLDEAIGLYMWNMEIASCLTALLCHFEIALRNNIHAAMSRFYSRGASSSSHWYDSIGSQLKPEARARISSVRHKRHGTAMVAITPAPGPDEIVSRLTFGFWPSVLKVVDARYADQLLSAIFPNHPVSANPADWKNATRRRAALSFIAELNTMRNRLAHFEPVWKFAALLDQSTTPSVSLPGSTTLAGSIARFQRLLRIYDAGTGALSANLATDLRTSSWRTRLEFLLTDRGIARYRRGKHVPAPEAYSPTEFRKRFSLLSKGNQLVVVSRAGLRGVFHPA